MKNHGLRLASVMLVFVLAISAMSSYPLIRAVATYPVRPDTNKDYSDDITGMWYPYTTDGTFNQATDTLTITGFNGVGKFEGLSLNNNLQYVYRAKINVPNTTGQVRLVFGGNNWQEHLALYIFGTYMAIYDLVGGVEQNNLGTASYSRPVNTDFEITIATHNGEASIWINGTCYFDGVNVPTYTGTCLGAYGVNFSTGNIVTVSDIDIFYTQREAPVKSYINNDYADDISGIWYPYTTDGTFDLNTKTLTITGFNGVGKFQGLSLNNDIRYVYKADINVPSSTGQMRLIFKGNDWQENVALYISASSMALYNLINGVEQNNLGTVNFTRPANTDFEVVFSTSNGKVSVWIDEILYFDEVNIPSYTGTCLGAYGSGFSSGDVITVSNIDIFYVQREIPEKPANNKDYAANITGMWYPYTTDGTFDQVTDTLTMTSFNGVGKFAGLTMDNRREYVYRANVNVPDSTGQVRFVFNGNTWQEHVALYMFGTSMTIYDLVGGVEQSVIGSVNYTRPVNTDFEVAIVTSDGKVSIWIDGKLYFDEMDIPSYTGECLGAYGVNFSSGNVTVSDIDIFYTSKEAPVKPSNNKDYADDITGMWYPYTTDGTFNLSTDTLTMTAYNGVGKFIGLKMDSSSEFAYKANVTVPDSTGQVRFVFNGNTWQDHVALYLFGTSMTIYDLVGGVEQNVLATVSYTRPVNTEFDIVIVTSDGKASVWIDGIRYFEDVEIPTYSGTCIGAYGFNFSSGNVTVSDIDIFYTSWKQSEFIISAYATYYHMNNQNPSTYFQNLKNSNVNLAILVDQPTTTDLISKLSACESIGLKYLASEQTIFTNASFVNKINLKSFIKQVTENNYFYGYYSWDEPAINVFQSVSNVNEKIMKHDTTRLRYSCLLPSYGVYTWSSPLSTRYDTYVNSFLSTVNPNVISSDYYPFSQFGQNVNFSTHEIWKDVGFLRTKSLIYNIPYWYVIQGIADYTYGTIGYMTPARLKVQINSALAYGAKEVSYFTSSDIILDAAGNESVYYDDITQINKETLNIGNLLFNSTPTAIFHGGVTDTFSNSNYLDLLSNSTLLSSLPNNIIAGVFESTNGKTYLALTNKSYTSSLIGTVSLDNYCCIKSFDANSNSMVTVSSNSNNFSVSLPAGGIKVYELS